MNCAVEIDPRSVKQILLDVPDVRDGPVYLEKAGRFSIKEGVEEITNVDAMVPLVVHSTRCASFVYGLRCSNSELLFITLTLSCLQDLKQFLLERIDSEMSLSSVSQIPPKNELPWKPSKEVDLSNTRLSKEQRNRLRALVDKYWQIFSRDEEDLGKVKRRYGEHDIELKNPKMQPILQKPYTVPFAKERIVDECVDRMLRMNIIQPTSSNWASPIVLVKKPDGSERFCVDCRRVNEVTVKDAFPMPNVKQKLNKLHGCQWFTSLDCTSGYWQIGMTARAQEISAFICNRGSFAYRVMPFGLCNAPATFQRIMETIVSKLPNSSAYLDDVLTSSRTFDEHIEHLEQLFIQLLEAGIKVKPSKCKVAQAETNFLGYKVSGQGITRCRRSAPHQGQKAKKM